MDEGLVIAGVVTRADQKHDQNFPLQKVAKISPGYYLIYQRHLVSG